MKSTKDFYSSVKSRRSMYSIGSEPILLDEQIIAIVNHAVLHTPSAFNSQNGRVVVLLGENHHHLWNITREALRKKISEDRFPATDKKLNTFASGYGTILFFEDIGIIESLQGKFPSYADRFPIWSHHSIGMLQYIIWTSLETEGYGASLQHYNPIIDDQVKERWNIPHNWNLVAQMPFGKPVGPAGDKEYMPLEDRVRIYK